MTTSGTLRIEFRGIGKALASSRLTVPKYQRSYAWEESEVRDLLRDLAAAIADNATEYFLGSVVVRSISQEAAEVVDGQQRLATTAILFAAIRDHFRTIGDKRAEQVESTFLFGTDMLTQQVNANIALNTYDHSFFLANVLKPGSAPAPVLHESHQRIFDAKAIAASHVAEIARNSTDATTQLVGWTKYLEHRAKVIWVEVPDTTNAFRIFETLNARGRELSPVDLLKNHIFSVSEDRIDEAQQHWTAMLAALEPVGGDEVVLTYLRHLWVSRHGPTRDRHLYDNISKTITFRDAGIEFAVQLSSAARSYAAILSPTSDRLPKHSETARRRIQTLNILRLEQFRPLLLACLEHLKPAEVTKVLKYLVSASVRLLIVGGLGGGTMESLYAQTALGVRSGAVKDAAGVRSSLSAHIPQDGEFEAAFKVVRVSQPHLARYYLQALEREERNDAEPELVPNDNPDEVNLEHILPQSPSAAWASIAPATAQALYNRLGNLALMKTRPNSAAGNQGMVGKVPFYKKSVLTLTKQLALKKTWDGTEIEKRQARLAKLAIKTWSLKF